MKMCVLSKNATSFRCNKVWGPIRWPESLPDPRHPARSLLLTTPTMTHTSNYKQKKTKTQRQKKTKTGSSKCWWRTNPSLLLTIPTMTHAANHNYDQLAEKDTNTKTKNKHKDKKTNTKTKNKHKDKKKQRQGAQNVGEEQIDLSFSRFQRWPTRPITIMTS